MSFRRLTAYAFSALVLFVTPFEARSQGVITTVAGTDYTFHGAGQMATDATLGQVPAVATDAAGNVYAADHVTNLIIKVSPDGNVQVVAGNGVPAFSGDGGPATSAALSAPYGLALDAIGNLYIADNGNSRIRMVSTTGIITTVAGNGQQGFSGDGGPATSASLNAPYSVAIDSSGNLYISDSGNHRIRKVNLAGTITTVAGNGQPGSSGDGGPATAASLNVPLGIAVDPTNNLYIADQNNFRIREVSAAGSIATVAGNGQNGFSGDTGPAVQAMLGRPFGVALDGLGDLYIADLDNNRVRMVSTAGKITTVAGNGQPGFSGDGGPATSASLYGPAAVATDAAGNFYVADQFNLRVRKVDAKGVITTVAGNGKQGFSGDGGPATSALLANPYGVAVDRSGNLYIADQRNLRIRKVTAPGTIITVAGNGQRASSGDGGPAMNASLKNPVGVAIDSAGNLYIADLDSYTIRKVDPQGIISTVAGNGVQGFSGDGGPATSASLSLPYGLAIDSADNLYIADLYSQRVRRVNTTGVITTVAGNGVPGFSGDGNPATTASLNNPVGVAVDTAGNLSIVDFGNDRIRKVSATGIISTIAGNGREGFAGDGGPATSASLNGPLSVTVDLAGNLYIADSSNYRVRRVSTAGTITTIAGNGSKSFSGDGGLATNASLREMEGVTVDAIGNLFIADTYNYRIREVLAAAPGLQASPLTLSFDGVAGSTAGGAAPAAQLVNLSSSGAGTNFSAAASDPWLTVNPAGGSTPAVLQVSVDPSQLSAGSYTGTISVTALGAAATVSVSLTVSPAASGKLGVGPAVALSVTQGSASTSTQLSVSNQGGGAIAFTASASTSTGGAWLQASPASGNLTPTTPASLTVTATPGNLGAGTYSGGIVVNSSTTGESITVPVTLSISAAPQKIFLSQTGLTFVAVEQGGAPLPQDFGILNTGSGSMNWSATAATLSGGSWLSISQASGTVATPFTDVSPVNVSIDPSGLKAGNYYGQIQVTSSGAANSPQAVAVVVNVLPPGSNPGPEVRPTGLIFIGSPGNSPGSQNVTVSNPQGSPITFGGNFFTVPTGGNWAQFVPTNATVQPNAPTQVIVQPDYTNLASGVYQGFVSLGFLDGSSRSVHILSVVAPPAGGSTTARAASGCTTLLVHTTALTDPSSSVAVGQPASLQARIVDNCGNLLTSGTVVATFSNSDAAVSLVHVGGGNWSGTWTPRDASQSRVVIQLRAFVGQGVTLLSGSASLTVSLSPGAAPVTFRTANAASFVGTYVSPGALIAIKGLGLADSTVTNSNPPLPTQSGGAQVLLGGEPLPLRYVSGDQVNAQVPFDLTVNTAQQLIVQRDATLSVPQDVVVAAAQPGIYTQDGSGTGDGRIFNGSTLVTASNPAKAGDVVTIYCNGLGAVTPPLPTGSPAPSAEPLARTVNPVMVTIGGLTAQVSFAGLAPGYPDVYQVNAVVPAGVASGQAEVVLTVAGQSSPPVTMAVQ